MNGCHYPHSNAVVLYIFLKTLTFCTVTIVISLVVYWQFIWYISCCIKCTHNVSRGQKQFLLLRCSSSISGEQARAHRCKINLSQHAVHLYEAVWSTTRCITTQGLVEQYCLGHHYFPLFLQEQSSLFYLGTGTKAHWLVTSCGWVKYSLMADWCKSYITILAPDLPWLLWGVYTKWQSFAR